MDRFRILPGLPGAGSWPEQFSKTGRGTHREGLVVEFFPDTPQAWVGNFQPGLAGYNAVLPHLDGTSLIVIAGGEAYVINPEERRLLTVFGGDIDLALVIPSLGLFVISSAGIHFEARDRTGLAWRTRRISWDGMQDIRIENDKLNGEAWSPIDNCYYPFSVDLRTGAVEGGSYNGPPG